MPLPPLALPELAPYLEVTSDRATFRNPTRDFVIQGAAIGVLLPVLWLLLAALVIAEEPRALLPALGVAGALGVASLVLAALVAIGGIVLARSRVTTVDSSGSLLFDDGARVPASHVALVFVGKPGMLMKWKGVGIRTSDGATRWVIRRIPPSRVRVLEGLANWLKDATGAPVDLRGAAFDLGIGGGRFFAAACYFPIQGIWLIASLLALIGSKDAVVRFAAKQSLAYYLLSGLVLVVWCIPVAGIGIAIGDHFRIQQIMAIPVIILILVPAIIRIVLGIVAMAKARSGTPWIIPGMGWLATRWLP